MTTLSRSWTKDIPTEKRLDCLAVAQKVYDDVEGRIFMLEASEQIRVQAFLPHAAGAEPDKGSLRYSRFMEKKFTEYGIAYNLSHPTSANDLKLMLKGAQAEPDIHGLFVYFPTPFDKREEYFIKSILPEKDIEGLTYQNVGRMVTNSRTFDDENKYEGVVPCTANAILTLLHDLDSVKQMFPKTGVEPGPFAVILNSSPRIGIPLQRMLTGIGASAINCHRQTREEDKQQLLNLADIVVTAFPAKSEKDLVRKIKPGAIVIDCSNDGNLHQDVVERASYISAYDNHLGQITTALALKNTVLCYQWQKMRAK